MSGFVNNIIQSSVYYRNSQWYNEELVHRKHFDFAKDYCIELYNNMYSETDRSSFLLQNFSKIINNIHRENNGSGLGCRIFFDQKEIDELYQDDHYFAIILKFCKTEIVADYFSGMIQHCDMPSENSVRYNFVKKFTESLSGDESQVNCNFSILLDLYMKNYNIDYLEKISDLKLQGKPCDDIKMYKNIALEKSKDPELYKYLFKEIKRAPGYQDRRKDVVVNCIGNMSFDDSCVKLFSSKLTKVYQREVANFLISVIHESTSDLKFRAKLESEKSNLKIKIEKLQRFAMNFILSNDKHYDLVRMLYSCVGKQNALFVAPIVANLLSQWELSKFKKLYELGG